MHKCKHPNKHYMNLDKKLRLCSAKIKHLPIFVLSKVYNHYFIATFNAERSTEKINVQTFVRFRLSHGSVRGHGSPRVTARNGTPIVHLNDYLVTSNPNITFITNSLILAAFHSFCRQWKPSTLQWLSDTLTQLLTQGDQLLRQLPALLHHLLMLQENRRRISSFLNATCFILLNMPKHVVRAGQCQVKSNVMMNNSEIPLAYMNYALSFPFEGSVNHRTGWAWVLALF